MYLANGRGTVQHLLTIPTVLFWPKISWVGFQLSAGLKCKCQQLGYILLFSMIAFNFECEKLGYCIMYNRYSFLKKKRKSS